MAVAALKRYRRLGEFGYYVDLYQYILELASHGGAHRKWFFEKSLIHFVKGSEIF